MLSHLFAIWGQSPKCTDKKYNNVFVIYMHEREKRASASEIYVFSDLKIHQICIHIQSMQWFGTLNDSMTDKTLTLREIYEYASERSERA